MPERSPGAADGPRQAKLPGETGGGNKKAPGNPGQPQGKKHRLTRTAAVSRGMILSQVQAVTVQEEIEQAYEHDAILVPPYGRIPARYDDILKRILYLAQ